MELVERIGRAIERITTGQAAMRVSVDSTDPDVVLVDCEKEITRLRAKVEEQGMTLGSVFVFALQGDTTSIIEIANRHEIEVRDGQPFAAAPELLEEITRPRAKVEELRQVLREVEWKGWPVMGDVGPMAACVSCGQLRAIGHDETCRLAAALSDSKEENDG